MAETLDRVRRLCMALPATTERPSHGEPTWFVRGQKVFVMSADSHHDDRVALWAAAPTGAQAALVAEDPTTFFVPPYVGGRGWVGVRLDTGIDEARLAEVIEEAYRTIAPRRLVAQLDEERCGGPSTGASSGPRAP